MVGVPGFEPGTSSLSGARSNQLSYTPELRGLFSLTDPAAPLPAIGGAKGIRTLDVLLAKQVL